MLIFFQDVLKKILKMKKYVFSILNEKTLLRIANRGAGAGPLSFSVGELLHIIGSDVAWKMVLKSSGQCGSPVSNREQNI